MHRHTASGTWWCRAWPPASSISGHAEGCTLDGFRDRVEALRRAGIEMILDVVFHHTTENGVDGPTLSWRGLAGGTWLLLDRNGRNTSYPGPGKTRQANHSVVRRMILDSLRHGASVMHAEGFHFDPASILSRGQQGQPLAKPPLLLAIESRPAGPGHARQCRARKRRQAPGRAALAGDADGAP